MDELKPQIKLSYITGLREVVLNEINKNLNFRILKEDDNSVYLEFIKEQLADIKRLRSVARAYIVTQGSMYHPPYISKHKSILGNLVEIAINGNKDKFKSFKIACAGSNSPEVKSIIRYARETYGLLEKEDSDMKIHIIKLKGIWEIGVQITPRPLSFRNYKERNMSGAMDPAIAYAVNSFCKLDKAKSYLNIFSGSATLLIEAAQCYPNIEKLIGFDNNKKHLSLAIQNIKKAGLIEKIQLKEESIFNKPDFGTFDAIVSDLPFGMIISKNENLEDLYQCFIDYCQKALNPEGKLVIYTSEYEILKKIILKSKFKIIKTLDLKFITSVDAYLYPKIFACELKKRI